MLRKFCALLCLCCCASAAESPRFTDVFVSGTGGYNTYRIPAIVTTTHGTVLAFCEGRKNSSSDTGDIDLLLKRSTNGGLSWEATQMIWNDGTNVCGNPAPVVDTTTGVIWLLMTWNSGADEEAAITGGSSFNSRRVYITSSHDDGLSWSAPKEITAEVKLPNWGWYATGPVNGIQMVHGPHQGRLIIPANHSEPGKNGEKESRSHVVYSDDHGATWHIGGIEEEKTNESTIAELLNGGLMHNMRSYSGKNLRAVAKSLNGGATWSSLRLDPHLPEPVCQGSLFRYSWPENGRPGCVLFANPASKKRVNMTLRASHDDCESWTLSVVLFPGHSAYSCLTKLPDGSIGCLFECGEKGPYEKIVLATVPFDSLKPTGTSK